VSDLARRTPLAGCPPWEHPRLRLAEIPFPGMLLLFGRVEPAAGAALADILGTPLPTQPGRLAGSGPHALMLAPGRWAVFAPEVLHPAIEAAAGGALGCVRIGEGRVGIAVTGPLAGELLAAGTAVDMDGRAWPIGAAAQTLMGKVSVLLCRFDDAGWHLFADASAADHVWRWLCTNAALVTAIADRATPPRLPGTGRNGY